MNFFEAQDAARRRTRVLVVLFVLAVAAITIAVYLLAFAVIAFSTSLPPGRSLFLQVAVLTPVFILGAATFRTHRLRRGGVAVAEMMGGRLVTADTTDPAQRRLLNVVEEMAIASGTPVPGVFLLPNDASINAFAAGFTFDDAVIGVTRGAVDTLSRDELQGVVAHEFSHILHGDMRLNMRLIGLLYGILAISIVGRGLINGITRQRSDRARKAAATGALIGIGLMLIGSIGVFFGRLIQAAVSRQREYLADAASVQYTRNPHGLGRALGKIAGSRAGTRLTNHHADEVGHLFFSNALGKPALSAFATHPPPEERIRRIGIDPAEVVVYEAPAELPVGLTEKHPPRLPLDTVMQAASGMAAGAVTADALVESAGTPSGAGLAAASRLMESLPADVIAAAHDAERAPGLLLALLARDADGGDAAAHQLAASVPKAARLQVVDLLMATIRALPEEKRAAVHAEAVRAIRADGQADMFEFAVYHVARRTLAPEKEAAQNREKFHSIAPLAAEAALLISAVAWAGAASGDGAQAAFDAGVARLPATAKGLALVARADVELGSVDAALGRMRAASPGVRRRLLLATATAAGQDGVLQPVEAEFVRAVAEAIDCPLPLVFAPEAVAAI